MSYQKLNRNIDLETAKKFKNLTVQKGAKETTMKVRSFKNEYDVTMLELKTKPRSIFISEKKAMAILATNEDADRIEPIVKHGRELFSIKHLEGDKCFVVGQKKIDAVLEAESAILLKVGS